MFPKKIVNFIYEKQEKLKIVNFISEIQEKSINKLKIQ